MEELALEVCLLREITVDCVEKNNNNQKENSNDQNENNNNQDENNEKDDYNINKTQSKNDKSCKVKNAECYKNRKFSLQWNNIENLIIKNAIYLDLSIDEAIKASIELNALIRLSFSDIRAKSPSALNKDSDFTNYWTILRNLEYKNKKNLFNDRKSCFQNLCYFGNRS